MATATKSKKSTTKTRAAATKKKVAVKKKPAAKKTVSKRALRLTPSQVTQRDRQLLAIWLLLVALFLAFVVKNYVIG